MKPKTLYPASIALIASLILLYYPRNEKSAASQDSVTQTEARHRVDTSDRHSQKKSEVGRNELSAAIAGHRETAATDLVRSWALDSPEVATRWVLNEVLGGIRDELLAESVSIWAEQNSEEAFRWAISEEAVEVWHVTANVVAEKWALSDPLGAMNAPLDGFDPVAAEAFKVSALSTWAKESPEDAAGWLEGNDPSARLALSAELVYQWAGQDPKAAEEWMSGNDFAADTGTMLGAIVSGWSNQSSEVALDWVTQHTLPSEGLVDPVRDVVNDWADHDPKATAEWLDQLESSEWKNEMVESFASTILEISPESAASWAQEITDEAMRGRVLSSLTAEWLQMDEAAASTWISENPTMIQLLKEE